MNDNTRKNKLIMAGTIGGGILLFALILFFTFRPTTPKTSDGNTGAQRNLDQTPIYSSLTESSQSFAVTYGGDADPNQNAVQRQFKIFDQDNLPLPNEVKSQLQSAIGDQLSRQLPPTDAMTFVQIDKDTIKCKYAQDCKFSFYIDSPEMYFDFSMKIIADLPTYQITQKPWVGR